MEHPSSLMKLEPVLAADTLHGVDIWNPDGVLENQDVRVRDGIIESIEPSKREPADRRLCLMPSGVDTQVHLRVPGQAEKETALTGVLSALHGGYGAILNMPNTRPVIDHVEALMTARHELAPLEESTGIQVLHSAAITLGQDGQELAPLEILAEAGAVAFTDDGKGVASDYLMAEAFQRLARLHLPLLQHAEMPGHGGVLAPGPVQARLGVPEYPAEREVEMLRRDLAVLSDYPDARYHLLHISSRDCLPLLKSARARGLKVTSEVTPHHLYFSTADIDASNSAFKMNPPIRSDEDRGALVRALAAGQIDWVATDHAPHEVSAKSADFERAAFGTVGMETALPVLLALLRRRQITPARLVQAFSTAPAKFLGLDQNPHEGWGRIAEGSIFRALLVDPHALDRKLEAHALKSLSKNSCFLGSKLPFGLVAHFTARGTLWLSQSPRMLAL